ncbi:hypothetical protein CASFOL_010305 [Castilleja foliolosa]|uniref:Uncharacterized protein n=1 Tax=Castilleja foliolosa TaxID=1961234 RepID=A0ABD3DSC6_9LAMI
MAAAPVIATTPIRRPVVNYTPSMWADKFTSFSLDHQAQEKYSEEIEALKGEARSMLLMAKGKTTSEILVLIDTLERLGVGYHFSQEIEEQLKVILNSVSEQDNEDLFTTALRFRLLRQHRNYVPCSVFDKFKEEDNKFKETLNSDAKGLLSLYEAAHLRIHGEEILDKAVAFTVHHLKHMVQQLESPLQDQVKRALEQPLHRGVSYARNRVVEGHAWALSHHFEPQYSYARDGVTKAIQMLTVLDDTYDNYATIEESDLFTKIMDRWNIDDIDQLPDYMKAIYKCVLRIYDDYEYDAAKQGKLFAVPYAKKTIKDICRAYNKGHKWCMGGPMPSFDNYIANTTITSCLYVLCSTTIPGMKSVSNETVDWLRNEPEIVKASAKVCRYLDDLGSFERESNSGQMRTGPDFYMKQYGTSMEETTDKFIELTEDAWKDLNKEWMTTNSIPEDMLEQILGYARAADFFYRSGQDGYTKTEVLVPHIVALFVDPIIII